MILRSTKELVYEPVNNLKGIIALEVAEWTRDKVNNRYLIKVKDYIVRPTGTTVVGEPLFSYEAFKTRNVIRTQAEIDGLFNFIATDIDHLNPFSNQLDTLIAQGLNLDTQQKPIYISTAVDWELIDQSLEVYVEPEPEV